MKKPKSPLFFRIIASLLVSLIPALCRANMQGSYAYAYSPLNLTYIPEGLAETLSIDAFTGGILASAILLIIVLLPVAIFEQKGVYGKLFVGLIVTGFCIAVGWLPTYFLIVLGVIVALMLSNQARDWISGV